METKKCSKCGEVKPPSEFGLDRSKKHGLANQCKRCKGATSNAWREKNRERNRANERAWEERNRGHIRERQRARYRADPEKAKAPTEAWVRANPEKVLAVAKRARDGLTKAYIASKLRIPVRDLTPELLALKREQLALKRLSREIKRELRGEK